MDNKTTKKRLGCIIIFAVIAVGLAVMVIFAPDVANFLLMKQSFQEYTSFGNKEIKMIRDDMGVTVEGSTTPVKLTVSHAAGDYCYQLWLKDIDDAEKFMEECFDGTYSAAEITDQYNMGVYDYEDYKLDSSCASYSCEFVNSKGVKRFDEYYIVFYKEDESFKAKLFARKT